MKGIIVASIVGVGMLGLGACAIPTGQQVAPQPAVTVTQAPPAPIDSTEMAKMRRTWPSMTAEEQYKICYVVRTTPDDAWKAFNKRGTSALTRQEFDQFFSEVC